MTLAGWGWGAVGAGASVIPATVDIIAVRRGDETMSRLAVQVSLRPVAGPVAVGLVAGVLIGLGWHLAQTLYDELLGD